MQISKQLRFRFQLLMGLCLLISLGVFSASPQKRQANFSNQYKQLGGSAEEIPSMRLPNPQDAGTRSKAAMIPIFAGDDLRQIEMPVDNPTEFKLMLLAPDAAQWKIEAALSKSDFADLRAQSADRGLMTRVQRTQTFFGIDGNQFPAEVFRLEALKAGVLKVRIDLPDSISTSGKPVGYLVASSESVYRLYSYIDTLSTVTGREIGIVASLFDKNSDRETGMPDALIGNIRRSAAVMTTPQGEVIRLKMNNEGNGVLRAGFVPQSPGKYSVQIFAEGTTAEGSDFLRTAEHSFEVAEGNLRINEPVKARLIDDLRWQIDLPVDNLPLNQKVIAHAEIWSNDQPIAWIGGMTEAKFFAKRSVAVSLSLDSRWLLRADASTGNFELRNVRLQNPDNSVVLETAERIPLTGVFVPENARSFSGEITDDMRQGVRPAQTVNDAVGGKLMLVHGYCSGDAWGTAGSAGQFADYVKFLDLNQNRTHDQFANLIKNYGASLPSFGIVAHSQGGAASLHLYTYYWSGLDYATGARLIQSVGTPYRGTALAGNLALLGQIFGAGCGSNYDLSYNGAAAWLANIPTWARAKVFYHTTSFNDVWWRYDYCNLATDPFLGDPDDGVVERGYAQLTGGNNLGHKTGWCHTGGMRDPGQTMDAARNANMNANAAR